MSINETYRITLWGPCLDMNKPAILNISAPNMAMALTKAQRLTPVTVTQVLITTMPEEVNHEIS